MHKLCERSENHDPSLQDDKPSLLGSTIIYFILGLLTAFWHEQYTCSVCNLALPPLYRMY